MARVTMYNNSLLASILSLLGYGLMMGGIADYLSGGKDAFVFVALGLGLMWLSGAYARSKAFSKWWKEVKKAGLLPQIRESRDTAVEVYQMNPTKKTLEKIRELNPDAADYIKNGCKEPANKKVTVTKTQKPVQQTPIQLSVQQHMYQPPVQQQPVYQQPVYQQPVYQQPVYQQPVYQQPVYNTAGSGMQTLDEQIDEICKIANANLNAQNDPQIYWECAQKLEQMLQAYPDNERLKREVAQILANYAWYGNTKPFAERRRVYNAALRSLTLEKKKRETTELDRRKFCLIWHAVNGGLDAAYLYDVNAMEEALQWLRTAATYKMEAPDAERQQHQNVAIPSVHFHVGYWLAKAYLAQTPPQKQKAKAVGEEALQVCPYALVRMCDVNPKRNTDTSTLVSREQLMSLLQLASQ